MSSNKNLHKAKKNQNDEHYTRITDIEKELKWYKDHFKGKAVYCNCDDPEKSDFWKHFEMDFDFYGLDRLVATTYEEDKPAYKLELIRGEDGIEKVKTPLKGNGDFRSDECIEILKGADVVVTNPPFSLFREYISQLIEYGKEFLVIGTLNVRTCKEIFKLIKDNKIWVGETYPKEFVQPDGSIKKFGNVGWYTNLPTPKRYEELPLGRVYKGNEDKYPKYDNYDAINVDKVVDIPMDYTMEKVVTKTELENLKRQGYIVEIIEEIYD